MGMTVEQPDELGGGGNFIDKPGVYHLLVVAVDENPADKQGQPLDAELKVSVSVLAGTSPEQKDRSTEITLWKSKEKGDQASKRITRFCLATCLIGQFQPGQKATVEPSDAVGRQIVAKFGWKQKQDPTTGKYVDTDRIDIHYSDIWHVDDVEVAKTGLVLDETCIANIPPELRKPVTSINQGGTSASPATGSVAPVTSTRAAGVDLSAV